MNNAKKNSNMEIGIIGDQKKNKFPHSIMCFRYFIRYLLLIFIICPNLIQTTQAATLDFTQTSYTVNEADGSATISVSLNVSNEEVLQAIGQSIGQPQPGTMVVVHVDFSTSDDGATAGDDYDSVTQNANPRFEKIISQADIASGNFGFSGTDTINIPIRNDSQVEQNEGVSLQIS